MSQLITTQTFEDILSAIIERGKISVDLTTLEETDVSTLNALKRFVNDRYREVAFSHKWPWRENNRIITPFPWQAPQTSVTLTNGDRRVTATNLVGTPPDLTWINTKFYLPGDYDIYKVVSIQDANTVLIDAPFGWQGDTQVTTDLVFFNDTYSLWPDYSDMIEIIPMDSSYSHCPLEPVTSEEMSKLHASSPLVKSDFPTHYTITDETTYLSGAAMGQFIMGYDFMGSPLVPSIIFYPGLLNVTEFGYARQLRVKYGKQIVQLSELDDEPLIPKDKRMILVYGGLCDWYSLQGKEQQSEYYSKKFQECLRKMKADFDKPDTTARLVSKRSNRRLVVYPRRYPDVD